MSVSSVNPWTLPSNRPRYASSVIPTGNLSVIASFR